MKLYHSSKLRLETLKPQQARKSELLSDSDVPSEELQKAIYFTSDYGYAVAMGSRPNGLTTINFDDKKITFQNSELFKPDGEIYIYEIDSNDIPIENLKQLENDKLQYVVENMNIPASECKIKTIKAREVLNYYELTNWAESLNESS